MQRSDQTSREKGFRKICGVLLGSLLLATCPLGARQRRAAAPAPIQPARARPENGRGNMARFRRRIETALASSGGGKAYWGVLVSDADTGAVLYTLNAERYFMPASNAKLFSTVLALSTLGPEFRVRTTIETAAIADSSGRLPGDLVLVGRGDANLSNRIFPYVKRVERNGPPERALADLADQVVASGVKQISGDVIADDSYFVSARFPPGWTVDDTVWSYGAAVSAIAINDNALSLQVRPGAATGAPLSIHAEPWTGLYEIRNDALTTAAGTVDQLRLSREPDSRIFRVSGTLPLGAPPRDLLVGVTEPAENAAAILMRLLQDRGVSVEGRSRALHADEIADAQRIAPRRVLAEHLSPPLLQDVKITNKLSLNLHAELLLRLAAREKGGALTLDDAVTFAAEFRKMIGVAPEDVLLLDGSGLSRGDLVTPQSVVQLLAYALRQPWGADFVATLPVAGEDGTLENRMKGTAAAGHIHAKTGGVEHVQSLSGYATSTRGEHLIFSIFGNNTATPGPEATAVVDAICVAMIEELGPAQAGVLPAKRSRARAPANLPVK